MKKYYFVLFTLLLVFFNLMLNGQSIIWSEDFPYVDGTTQGSGVPPKWTRDISNCSLGSLDYVEVRSQTFRAKDTDGEAVFITETIDISAYTDVSVSFNLSEIGRLENADYFRSYYMLDGGIETLFETNGDLFNDFYEAVVSQTGLNGNTLTLVFRFRNSDDREIYIFDNIYVFESSMAGSCANAVTISEVTDLPFNTFLTSASGQYPGCGGFDDPIDVWYAYTPSASGTATFDLCGSSFDTRIAVWDACGGTVLDCNDDNGPVCTGTNASIQLDVVLGATYYVQVGGYQTDVGTGDLTIALTPSPSNNDCISATVIGEVSNLPFSTVYASASGYNPGCAGLTDPIDLWYVYSPVSDGNVEIDLCGSSFNTRLAVWDGCGGTVLYCNDNSDNCDAGSQQSYINGAVTAGNTYYIQIGGRDAITGDGFLSLSFTPVPTNNECAGATPVGNVTDMSFSTLAASASGANPGCGGITDPVDIWYSYTATATGVASFDLCGSSYDTRLAIWDGCGGLVLACNDDDGPVCSGLQSSIHLAVVSGQTYYLQIGGKDSETGEGDLTISVVAYAINNECVGATPINEVTDYGFSTVAASQSGVLMSCGGGNLPYDIWFAYTATVSGSASFDLCGSDFDTRIAIWDACGGIELDCNNDDGPVCSGVDASLVMEVTSGTTYYVQVAGYQETVGNGDLTIDVISFVGNDNCASALAIGEVTDLPFSTLEATASGINPGCGGLTDPVDIWFAYTANFSGIGVIDLCGSGFDTRLGIWDACGGALIGCNDNDGSMCAGSASSYKLLIVAGTTYYIQVGGYESETGIGDLSITVYSTEMWTGAINGDWTNPGNWGNNAVPLVISDITIPGNSPNFPVIDKSVECNNLRIYDGAQLTCVTGCDLTINGHLFNGAGSSGLFRMNDGICTVYGNYYSEIGATTDINGGIWSFENWNRSTTSIWSKGNIHLSGGIINSAGSIVWSNYNVIGVIDGPVTVNIGGSFRNSSDDWTITDGTFNMLGSDVSKGTEDAEVFYILASTFGPGNYVATPRLNIRPPENIVYSTSSEGDITGVWVLDDIRVDSGYLSTSGFTGSKSIASMNDFVIVEGDLIIGPKGKMTADVSGSFTVHGQASLMADQNNMASFIDNGNTSIEGGADVQQYLSSERWHLVSPPVTGATINTYLDIYLKEYNEPDNSWTYLVEPTSMPMNSTKGYAAWTDDDLTGSTTVSYTGDLNSGDYYIPSFSFTMTSPSTGWNLVGNPYPSTIQWNATWPKTDLSEWACIHNNGNDGCYNAVTGAEWPDIGSMPDGTLGPTQGFWVRATSDIANMTIENSQRMHNNQGLYKESFIEMDQSIRLRIDGNNDFDAVLIQFTEGATSGFDDSFDLEKRWGYDESPNVYTIHPEDALYSVDVRPQIESEMVIPIGFETGLTGYFVMEATQFDGLAGEYQVIVEDIKEGIFTQLKKNTQYGFSGDPQDENHRFNLHFKDINFNTGDNITNPVFIYSFENDVYVLTSDIKIEEVVIFDIMGHEVVREYGIDENVLKIPVDSKTGFYTVRARTSDFVIIEKVYIK